MAIRVLYNLIQIVIVIYYLFTIHVITGHRHIDLFKGFCLPCFFNNYALMLLYKFHFSIIF